MFFEKEENYNVLTEDKIRKWFLNFSDEPLISYHISTKGSENNSIFIETKKHDYVMRVSSIPVDSRYLMAAENRLIEEMKFLTFLQNNNREVPITIESNHSCPFVKIEEEDQIRYIILMKKIKGKHPGYTYRSLREIAARMAQVHHDSLSYKTEREERLGYSAMEYRLENMSSHNNNPYFNKDLYLKYSELYSSVTAEIKPYFKIRPKLMIHNDLKKDNVLFVKGKLEGIIDFCDSRVSIIEEDLGCLIWDLSDSLDYKRIRKYVPFFLKEYAKYANKMSISLSPKMAINYALERYLVINLYYLIANGSSDKKQKYQVTKAGRQLKTIENLLRLKKKFPN
jgi:Ser/Thr protein kinase RdoA (MazF antagonist)